MSDLEIDLIGDEASTLRWAKVSSSSAENNKLWLPGGNQFYLPEDVLISFEAQSRFSRRNRLVREANGELLRKPILPFLGGRSKYFPVLSDVVEVDYEDLKSKGIVFYRYQGAKQNQYVAARRKLIDRANKKLQDRGEFPIPPYSREPKIFVHLTEGSKSVDQDLWKKGRNRWFSAGRAFTWGNNGLVLPLVLELMSVISLWGLHHFDPATDINEIVRIGLNMNPRLISDLLDIAVRNSVTLGVLGFTAGGLSPSVETLFKEIRDIGGAIKQK